MSRWKAAAIHLGLSAAIAIGVIALIALVWFPGPLFEATGSRELVMLLIGIDVAIGPLITLIVYREGKRGMRFDLAFIAVCQVVALVYGLSTFLVMRPAYLVFAVDRIVAVPAKMLSREDLAEAPPEFRRKPWFGAEPVAVKLPEDPAEREALFNSAMEGKDVERYPKYYVPWDSQRDAILARAVPLDRLGRLGGGAKAAYDAFLAERGGNAGNYVYLPLHIPRGILTAVLRREDARIEEILPIEPPGGVR